METETFWSKLKSAVKRAVEKVVGCVKKIARKVSAWWDRNKEDLKVIVPAAAAIVAGTQMSVSRIRHSIDGLKRHSVDIYDRSHGHYWTCRRKPTVYEQHLIDTRHDGGENYYDILSDLKLIKRGFLW